MGATLARAVGAEAAAAAAASKRAAAEVARAAAKSQPAAKLKPTKAEGITKNADLTGNANAPPEQWRPRFDVVAAVSAFGAVCAAGFGAFTYFRSQEGIPRFRLRLVTDENRNVLELNNTGSGVLRVLEIAFAYNEEMSHDWNPESPKVKAIVQQNVSRDVSKHFSYASVHNGPFEVAPHTTKALVDWYPKKGPVPNKSASSKAASKNKESRGIFHSIANGLFKLLPYHHANPWAAGPAEIRTPTKSERKDMVRQVRLALGRGAARIVYTNPMGRPITIRMALNHAIPMPLLRCAWEFDSTVPPSHAIVKMMATVREAQSTNEEARESWRDFEQATNLINVDEPFAVAWEQYCSWQRADRNQELARRAAIVGGVEALRWCDDPARHRRAKKDQEKSEFAKAASRVRDAVDTLRRRERAWEFSRSRYPLRLGAFTHRCEHKAKDVVASVEALETAVTKWKKIASASKIAEVVDPKNVDKKIEAARNSKLKLKVVPNKDQQDDIRSIAKACVTLLFDNDSDMASDTLHGRSAENTQQT